VYSEPKTSTSKLCSLIAYYPSSIPDPSRRLSSSFRVLVHLAQGTGEGESTVGVARRPEVLGIQGRRRVVQKRITPGIGTGGLQSRIEYPVYSYEGVDAGFAEHDLDEYDAVADALAWSRSLSMVRRGFSAEVDLERVWEENEERTSLSDLHCVGLSDMTAEKFHKRGAKKIMETYTTEPTPSVNYTPTMTGGLGHEELFRFYNEYFMADKLPIFHLRLISRTIGADRIVDELYIQFKHTIDMPWVLPSVKPTGKKVEIVVVSIAGMRGGKVWSERIYWDQASVLFQVGLLDPDHVPEEARKNGLEMLPVAGSEAARKIMDFESEDTNDMIDDW
jgi:hypothetical protein